MSVTCALSMVPQVLGRAGPRQILKPAVPRDNRWEPFGTKDQSGFQLRRRQVVSLQIRNGGVSRNATRKRAVAGEEERRARTGAVWGFVCRDETGDGMCFAGDPWSNEGRLCPAATH